MKRIVLIMLFMQWFLMGWQNENDSFFDMPLTKEDLTFKSIAGGAIMYYKLPDDSDIVGIRVRYKDAFIVVFPL